VALSRHSFEGNLVVDPDGLDQPQANYWSPAVLDFFLELAGPRGGGGAEEGGTALLW